MSPQLIGSSIDIKTIGKKRIMITKEQLKDYIDYQFTVKGTKDRYMWKNCGIWFDVQTIAFSASSNNEYKGIIELIHSEKPSTKAAFEWFWKNDNDYCIERIF